MGGFYRAALIILLELGPILLTVLAIALIVRRRARPQLVAHETWRLRRVDLEAEVVRLSHATGEVDALMEAQGELAAHEVAEPPLPWWSRR